MLTITLKKKKCVENSLHVFTYLSICIIMWIIRQTFGYTR